MTIPVLAVEPIAAVHLEPRLAELAGLDLASAQVTRRGRGSANIAASRERLQNRASVI